MGARLAGLILTGSSLCFGQPKQPASLGSVQSLIDSGKLAEARQTLAPLRTNEPKHPAILFTAAVLEYREGNFGFGLEILEGEPSLAKSIDVRILRAATLDALGRDAEAERELERLVSLPGAAERPLLHLGYGQLLLQRGANEEALARFDRAIRLAPGYGEVQRWRAIALMRLGRTREAIQSAESAEKSAPASVEVHSLLLKLYRSSGDSERAAGQLQWLREHSGEAR